MKIIIKGTADEISDLVKLQNRICSADTARTFGKAKTSLYTCVKNFCAETDTPLKPESFNASSIADVVNEYSKRHSECLQGDLSELKIEKISSIMALIADVSLADATEVIEHVKNIVLNELPKYTTVSFSQ